MKSAVAALLALALTVALFGLFSGSAEAKGKPAPKPTPTPTVTYTPPPSVTATIAAICYWDYPTGVIFTTAVNTTSQDAVVTKTITVNGYTQSQTYIVPAGQTMRLTEGGGFDTVGNSLTEITVSGKDGVLAYYYGSLDCEVA